jgi:hypothetical protein
MLKQLQQMIAQSPQLWMQGLGQAERMGERERLYALTNSQNFADGLLALAGIMAQQEQFQTQQGLQQRGMELQENEAGMRAEGLGIERARTQASDRRAQEASQREAEAHGLRMRAGEFGLQEDQALSGLRRRAMELGLTGQETQNALGLLERQFLQATQGERIEGAGLETDAKRQGLEAGAQQIRAGEQQMGAQQQRMDWENRFRSAKTDEERHQIIGENPDAWLQMWTTGQQVGAARSAAEAKLPNPTDYAIENLTKAFQRYQQMGTVGAEGMVQLGETQQTKARELQANLMALMGRIRSGEIAPNPNESPEAFLGRALSMLAEIAPGAPTGVDGPGAPAPAQADDPFGIGG